jgi:hypothetical protein
VCLVRGGQSIRLASNNFLFVRHKLVNEKQEFSLIGVLA